MEARYERLGYYWKLAGIIIPKKQDNAKVILSIFVPYYCKIYLSLQLYIANVQKDNYKKNQQQ